MIDDRMSESIVTLVSQHKLFQYNFIKVILIGFKMWFIEHFILFHCYSISETKIKNELLFINLWYVMRKRGKTYRLSSYIQKVQECSW